MSIENYIYLKDINEPEDNHLRLTFFRSKYSNSSNVDISDINTTNSYSSIDIDDSLPIIQLDFDWYIGYSVINECFTVLDKYELSKGNAFRIYSKSRYLDFINAGTIATEEYPGPFKHYEIACLNHIIDIVSVSEPTIKELK
jgi:hypothetical protein